MRYDHAHGHACYYQYLMLYVFFSCLFFFNDTATTEIYTLSLHDALPISRTGRRALFSSVLARRGAAATSAGYRSSASRRRSEEHTSELPAPAYLVCRLLLEKKKTDSSRTATTYLSATTTAPCGRPPSSGT